MKKLISFVMMTILTQAAFAKDTPWWPYDKDDVKYALCRRAEPESTVDLKNYFLNLKKGYDSDSLLTLSYKRIEFKNEHPQLIASFVAITSPSIDRIDQTPETEDILDLAEIYSISPNCNTVYCASQKIFGEFVGPAMVYLHIKYQLNTSPLSFLNADSFNSSEMKSLLSTLELLPENLLRYNINKKMVRFKRGYAPANQSRSVVANSAMNFFDLWEKLEEHERQGSMLHEFGHNIADLLNNGSDYSKEWLHISSWTPNDPKSGRYSEHTCSNTKVLISGYSHSSPAEDFAEAITAYRLNPLYLQKRAPEKYDFLKKYVFLNNEYINVHNCEENQKNTVSRETPLLFTKDQYLQTAVTCAGNLRRLDKNDRFYSIQHSFNNCAIKELSKKLLGKTEEDAPAPLTYYGFLTSNSVEMQKHVDLSLTELRKLLTQKLLVMADEKRKSCITTIHDAVKSLEQISPAKNFGYPLISNLSRNCDLYKLETEMDQKQRAELTKLAVSRSTSPW